MTASANPSSGVRRKASMGPGWSSPDDTLISGSPFVKACASMGPGWSSPDDLLVVDPDRETTVKASMGPGWSSPDDPPPSGMIPSMTIGLQWGRVGVPRMTTGRTHCT